jgi:hypothetical protein
MPLAVADTTLPADQLIPLVTSLNQAYVPPAQFVRVVSYAPTTQPDFVPFVQTQVARGVSGPALVTAIDRRVPAPKTHPHGGPPGQLKKLYGYQTGAQVVHGTPPPRAVVAQPRVVVREHGHGHGRSHGHTVAAQPRPLFVPQPIPQAMPPQGHGRGPQGFGPPGQMKGGDNGHGNGHGKGHGKD